MLRSARAIVITSVVAAWLSGTSAPAAAAARKVVVVALVDGAAPRASRQLERALRAQFSDLALTFRVERVERLPPRTPERLRLARAVAKRHGAIAVLWHDAGPQLYLYFASSSADRLLVRSVDAHGSTERYEALALLARGHLRTMLAGGRIGVAAAAAPPARRAAVPAVAPPPAVRASPRAPRRRLVGLELGYALDLYADEVAATHAAHVAIVLAPWRRVSLSVSARLLGRASHSDERAGVTVRRVPLLADARVHLVRLGRVAIAAIAGVGVEIVSNDARAFAGLHAAQAADQVFAFVEAGASVSLRLAGQVSLFARLTATVPLERLRYVVSVGPATQVLLSPWRVQPGLRVGLFADVL